MIIKIPITIYKTVVYIYVDETDEVCQKHYRGRVGPKGQEDIIFDTDTEARTILHSSLIYFIRFKGAPTVQTITHEFLHVVMACLRDRGMTPSWDSEEAYTYLLGHLVGEFYKKSKCPLKII